VDRPEVAKPAPSLLRNYAVLIYTAVVLVAVLSVANLIISDHNVRFDLTPDKRFSLSEFDKRVLSNLNQPVKVMAFVRTEDASYLDLADLLFQAAAYTPLLTYQVIDVNKSPGLARQYGVSSYGEVVVECGTNRRDFDNARSDELIPAVLQVSSNQNKKIYLTTGHGERDLYSSDKNSGFSQWRMDLEQNNYQFATISLFASDVPDDAAVVMTIGPEKDFLPEELAELQKYLARGGHFVVMMDPYDSPSLAKFLQQYHIDFSDKVVVDPTYRLTQGEILTARMPLHSDNSPITRTMSGDAVFSLARAIFLTGQPGAAAPDNLVLQQGEPFLRSSHESWASADPKAATTGITDFDEGRDTRGPIDVGVEMDFAPAADPHIPVQKMTRIAAFGSSIFASNQFFEMLGDRDLAVSVVNELAGDEMLIASRERFNEGNTAGFYVTSGQSNMLGYLGALGQTLLMLLIATAVFVRRRFFA